MKKVVLVVLVLAMATYAFGDNVALTIGNYDEYNSAHIEIYAYMVGILYSLNNTQICFDGAGENGLTPNEWDRNQETVASFTTPAGVVNQFVQIQNDGGITMDVEGWISTIDASGTPWDHVAYTPTPGVDEYCLECYMQWDDGAYDNGNLITGAGFLLAEASGTELTGTQGILAHDPADANAEIRELIFGIIAPSSATLPGGPVIDGDHHFTVSLDCMLAD